MDNQLMLMAAVLTKRKTKYLYLLKMTWQYMPEDPILVFICICQQKSPNRRMISLQGNGKLGLFISKFCALLIL